MWVILGADTVVYLLDPSRGHEVPESPFGSQASGVLEVDRYSGYKAMTPVKGGLLLLAFCSAHVRRDFVAVGKSWTELTPWALEWLRRIRHIYQVNRERLQHPLDSVKFPEQDVLLRRAVEAMRAEAVTELSDPELRQPCRKILESLQEHWSGLVRFVDDPRIPMDNNASERAGSRAGRGAKELLRIRLVVEWPAGSDDVFAVGHAGALANQSALVADVVLRELCGGRRQIA